MTKDESQRKNKPETVRHRQGSGKCWKQQRNKEKQIEKRRKREVVREE